MIELRVESILIVLSDTPIGRDRRAARGPDIAARILVKAMQRRLRRHRSTRTSEVTVRVDQAPTWGDYFIKNRWLWAIDCRGIVGGQAFGLPEYLPEADDGVATVQLKAADPMQP